MRKACEKMTIPIPLGTASTRKALRSSSEVSTLSRGEMHSRPAGRERGEAVGAVMRELVEGLREAAALLYNVTGRERCFSLASTGPAAGNAGPWGECADLDPMHTLGVSVQI